MNTFEFYRLRWHFQALGPLAFPFGASGNVVRGAFGLMLRQTAPADVYARLFEPSRARESEQPVSPSGLRHWPRPFLFRTAALEGRQFAPGEVFSIDMHLFDCRPDLMPPLRATFERMGEAGLGPGRGRAALLRVEQLATSDSACEIAPHPGPPSAVCLDPDPADSPVRQVRLRFLTPTELKGAPRPGSVADAAHAAGAANHPAHAPEFGLLFARLRDRISTLRALYGAGPLEIDFRALGARARSVELVSSDVHWIPARRRSSRTGQSHPLGGFTGVAAYAGDLAEFLPMLRAARWTGIGRQTVWGKGDVRVMAEGE